MRPLVLPFDPVRGWNEADLMRRAFTLAFPVFAALYVITANWIFIGSPLDGSYEDVARAKGAGPALDAAVSALLVAGMICCYHVARVLRPYHGSRNRERRARHITAAIATSPGCMIVLLETLDNGPNWTPGESYATALTGWGTLIMLGVAIGFGLLSAVWGASAFVVRAGAMTASLGSRAGGTWRARPPASAHAAPSSPGEVTPQPPAPIT